MRAAVFHGAKDIRIENVDAPTEVGPGHVLLRPFWCGARPIIRSALFHQR